MEESAELAERLAKMAHDRGATSTATRHRERAADVREEAEVIRAFLLRPVAPADETDEDRGATAASVAAG
jgi:hypothetical protein